MAISRQTRSDMYAVLKKHHVAPKWNKTTNAQMEEAFNVFTRQQERNKELKPAFIRYLGTVSEDRYDMTRLEAFITNPQADTKVNVGAKALYKMIDDIVIPSNMYLLMGAIETRGDDEASVYRVITDFQEIKELLKKIIKGFDVREYDNGEGGSDKELLYDIVQFGYRLTLEWKDHAVGYQQRSGAYFKYYNKTKFDLKKYQIFSKYDSSYEDDKETCLIYALKQSGLEIEEAKINSLKMNIFERMIKATDLKSIAMHLGITIELNADADKQHIMKYNKGAKQTLRLALVDSHYFLDEKCGITKYALENYHQCVNHSTFPKCKNLKTRKPSKELESSTVIRKMFEQKEKFFEPISLSNIKNKQTIDNIHDYEQLKEPELRCKCEIPKEVECDLYKGEKCSHKGCIASVVLPFCFCKNAQHEIQRLSHLTAAQPFRGRFKLGKFDPNENHDIWFIDVETAIPKDKTLGNYHQAFAIAAFCYVSEDNYKKYYFDGPDCVANFMFNCLKNHSIVYAHNQGFDVRQFITAHYQSNDNDVRLFDFKSPIETGTKLKSLQCKLQRNKEFVHIVFKDTMAFIQAPLKKFPAMFDLGDDMVKEVYPYTLLNEQTWDQLIPLEECYKHLKSEADNETFKANAMSIEALHEDKVDFRAYTKFYCVRDVDIMARGFMKFRTQILEVCEEDIVNLISTPQLADRFYKKQGCHDGCYKISGIAQDFIRSACVGGRTMLADNKKHHVKVLNDDETMIDGQIHNAKLSTGAENLNFGPLADYDANSLYPSAMTEIKGFLRGVPKVLSVDDCKNFDQTKHKYDQYFIEIEVESHLWDLKFPLLSIQRNGVRNFTNDIDGKRFRVDATGLEEAITHHGIKYRCIRGYYFNEGFNNKVRDTTIFMYKKRQELKSQKNKLEAVYKLIMNSGYGKYLQKPITTKKQFLNKKELNRFVSRNYKFISTYHKINDDLYVVKTKKSFMQHFASPHIGCQVLSMSKRIMNNVMCLAEKLNINIYYQDTDSMHIHEKALPYLKAMYAEKHGKDLDGNYLCEFSSDFKVDGGSNARSVEGIFVGKKVYVDKLAYEVGDETKNTYHVRAKGVSTAAVIDHDQDIMSTYKNLYDGKAIKFELGNYIPLQLDQDYRARANTRCTARTLQFK